jgi:hypothetical protein
MKVSNLLFSLLFASAAVASRQAHASGSDVGACHYTADARESWKESWARQLGVLDPKHAAQLSKVAAEIVDGRVDALKVDIEDGLNPNATLTVAIGPKGSLEMSLLALAVGTCQDAVVRELVLVGAAANGGATSTPLVVAAENGEDDLAEFLIEHGALIDKIDANGHTALEDAVRLHQLSTVQTLLKYGPDVNRVVGGNGTILDLVAYSSDPVAPAIAKELMAHGAASGLRSH